MLKPPLFKEPMTKQAKNKEPVAVSTGDQAPVISAEAFAPYAQEPMHGPDYSKTLLEKSNALAADIFKDKQGYERYTRPWLDAYDNGISEVSAKNNAFFDRLRIDNEILRTVCILPLDTAAPASFKASMRIGDLGRKLRHLEKRYEAYEILNDEARERIISVVLVPDAQFGVSGVGGHQTVYLRYHTQSTVAAGILTEEEVDTLQAVLNYVITLRTVMRAYRPRSGEWAPWSAEELLTPILPPLPPLTDLKNAGGLFKPQIFHPQPVEAAKMVAKMKELQAFLDLAFPYQVRQDHIPGTHYPTDAASAWMKLTVSSGRLRDASLGYINEEKSLADLYDAIVEIYHATLTYLQAQSAVIAAYFQYLNRIGLSFEDLVKESSERIKDGDVPW